METKVTSVLNSMEFRDELQPLLNTREELVWTGRPKQGFMLRNIDRFMVPFSILWSVVSLLGVGGFAFSVIQNEGGLPLFLVPHVVIFGLGALYLTVGRFLIDAYKRAQFTYGITNQRIIIQNKGIGGKTTSYDLKSLKNVILEPVNKEGRGTIRIGEIPDPFGFRRNAPEWSKSRYTAQLPGLEEIPNVQEVYALIQDLRD